DVCSSDLRYRTPTWSTTVRMMFQRAREFLTEAGTVILAFTIVLWALLSFPKPSETGDLESQERISGSQPSLTTGEGAESETASSAETAGARGPDIDRKSTRLNSSHVKISYAVFCLKKKKKVTKREHTQRKTRTPRKSNKPINEALRKFITSDCCLHRYARHRHHACTSHDSDAKRSR